MKLIYSAKLGLFVLLSAPIWTGYSRTFQYEVPSQSNSSSETHDISANICHGLVQALTEPSRLGKRCIALEEIREILLRPGPSYTFNNRLTRLSAIIPLVQLGILGALPVAGKDPIAEVVHDWMASTPNWGWTPLLTALQNVYTERDENSYSSLETELDVLVGRLAGKTGQKELLEYWERSCRIASNLMAKFKDSFPLLGESEREKLWLEEAFSIASGMLETWNSLFCNDALQLWAKQSKEILEHETTCFVEFIEQWLDMTAQACQFGGAWQNIIWKAEGEREIHVALLREELLEWEIETEAVVDMLRELLGSIRFAMLNPNGSSQCEPKEYLHLAHICLRKLPGIDPFPA